jgi:hypothetical protein
MIHFPKIVYLQRSGISALDRLCKTFPERALVSFTFISSLSSFADNISQHRRDSRER